ncbi:ubiquinone/menaquinone biosynthesis protein [Thermoplasmatales archaeon SG8-52-4]|nr:MAG: ubiquinone/menaquinone biosynthesis protein [Thermoplasmatales archaeon SG8-52-4]
MTDIYTKKSMETWNAIACSFDLTRKKPWKECIEFINSIPIKSVVADIGCGNGRHLIPCAKRCKKVIGLDVSDELLKIVNKKINDKKLDNVSLIHSDAVNIPLKKNSINQVLYIATLHNISKRYRRIKSLKEINRILTPEGYAFVSVWSRWQDKFRQHFMRNYRNIPEKKEFGDTNIYWKQHGLNVSRYYHLYSMRELRQDLISAGFKIEKLEGVKFFSKSYYDNYFALIKKEIKK